MYKALRRDRPIADISKFILLLYFCLCLTIQVHRNWGKIIFYSSILELQGILDYTLCKCGLYYEIRSHRGLGCSGDR